MEKPKKYVCCLGCLTNVSEITLQSYIVQNENIKSIFQADSIYLCYLCKRIAQKAEMFIQNVQSNQILLENFQNIMDSTFQLVRMQIQPLVNLNESAPIQIMLSGDKTDDVIEKFTIVETCIEQEVKIKLEMKEEEGYLHDHLEGEFVDDDEFQESCDVKEENEFSLRALVKEEVKMEHNLKTNQSKKSVKKNSKKDENLEKLIKEPRARTVYITKEECLREKEEMMQDEKYINSTYKCEDCVKGFTFKASYEKHMERHSKENGDYVCDICKQRWHSEDKLHSHRRSHLVRYKCAVCSLTRVSRLTIQDHYTAFHCFGFYQYNCPQCPKVFKRKVSLRKHVHYSHTHAQRVECAHCRKSYANKEVLKSHMIMRHPKHVGAVAESKRFVCQECGMAFKAPSHLKKHSIKHSHKRDYYCVECDKSFKSDSVLKQHLKTASPHVNYLELPLPCSECDKRFAIRRDLDRHVNRVHLNVRPYQCDRCDKAYVNNWSLNEHRRIVHEGYKRPLRYSCTFCSKVFDRSQILKGHLRTHTGERPYQCSKCPAKFSQSSVLGTHVKLIHLKLTRDGKPKALNVK